MTFIAPSGGVKSGVGYVVSGLFLVAGFDAKAGEECEGATEGVFKFPKNASDTPSQFDSAYWDAANKRVTTASSGNTKIGVFYDSYAANSTEAGVRLNGVAVA